MYAFIPIALVLVGAALVLVVFIRKIPALAELPEDQDLPGRRLTKRMLKRLRAVNWSRYQRVFVRGLLAFIEQLRRLSVRFARRSEASVKQLRTRMVRLTGNGDGQESPAFSSRIKKRTAFLEEERQLIEQLTANPDDTEAYRRLGNLYLLAGNTRDARAALTELLRRDPENEWGQRKLAELDGSASSGGERQPQEH